MFPGVFGKYVRKMRRKLTISQLKHLLAKTNDAQKKTAPHRRNRMAPQRDGILGGRFCLSCSTTSRIPALTENQNMDNIQQKTQTIKRKIQQFFNDDFPIDTSSISSALADLRRMFSLKYEGGSSYGPISTPQGTMGIRLANHNASGDNFAKDEGDFFVSIFIEKQVFPHQKTHIPYREFWFPKETFEQDRTGVVNAVVNIVASAIETGEAVDTSGLSKMTDYPNEFETQGSRGQGQDLTSTANQPAGSDDVKESLAKAYKYSKGNTMKRRINENAKITLTMGQLKRLVKENSEYYDDKFACPYCGSNEKSFEEADEPVDGYHDGHELVAWYSCEDCGKTYGIVYSLTAVNAIEN